MSSRIAVVLFLLSFVIAGAAGAAFGASKFERVTMIFQGGPSCVAIDKPNVTIFRHKKPKRVEWSVTVPGRYWEIRYQPSGATDPTKKPGEGNYFLSTGQLDIPCNSTSVRSDLPTGITKAKASWPYMVKVYECNGSAKGRLLCELDPMVDWGD